MLLWFVLVALHQLDWPSIELRCIEGGVHAIMRRFAAALTLHTLLIAE